MLYGDVVCMGNCECMVACRVVAMLYCDVCVRGDAVYIGNRECSVSLGGHVVNGYVM
jgi:hypothetical protein